MNNNDDDEHFNELFNFLEEENKKIFKKTRWHQYSKAWVKLKKLKWIVMPEYVFLRDIFKKANAVVIKTGYWLDSGHNEKQGSIMVLLIAISLYIYQIINNTL